MPKLTIKDYAKSRGISDKYIYRMISEGVIPKTALTKKGGKTLVEKERADIGLDRNTTSALRDDKPLPPVSENVQIETSRRAGTEKLSLNDAKTLTQRYRAALLKIELDEKTGRLIDSELIKISAFNKARAVRDALLNIPDRISPIIAAESNQNTVAELLTQELKNALEGLSA